MKLYVERVAGEVHVAGVGLGHWRCGSGVVVASFTSISVSHGLCLVWVLFCFHFQLSVSVYGLAYLKQPEDISGE